MKRNHLPHTEQGSQQLCLARPPSGAKSPRVLQTAGGHGRSPASQQTDTHSLRSKSFACRVCLIYQDTKNSSPSEQLGATVTTWFLTEMHLPKCRLVYHFTTDAKTFYALEDFHLHERQWKDLMALGRSWSGFTSPAGDTLRVAHILLTTAHKEQTQASRETLG